MDNYMSNEDYVRLVNNEFDQMEFDELLNKVKGDIVSHTIDAYGVEYEDADGLVVLRIEFDQLDRDLFYFEFVEDEINFVVKDFKLELLDD